MAAIAHLGPLADKRARPVRVRPPAAGGRRRFGRAARPSTAPTTTSSSVSTPTRKRSAPPRLRCPNRPTRGAGRSSDGREGPRDPVVAEEGDGPASGSKRPGPASSSSASSTWRRTSSSLRARYPSAAAAAHRTKAAQEAHRRSSPHTSAKRATKSCKPTASAALVRAVFLAASRRVPRAVPPLLEPRDDAGLPRGPIPASQRHTDARPVENGAPPEPGEDGGPLELERRRCAIATSPESTCASGVSAERLASGTVPGKTAGAELLGQEPAVATGARMGDRATAHRASRPFVREHAPDRLAHLGLGVGRAHDLAQRAGDASASVPRSRPPPHTRAGGPGRDRLSVRRLHPRARHRSHRASRQAEPGRRGRRAAGPRSVAAGRAGGR